MAETTPMNPNTPMPSVGTFRLQMEGLATAAVYVACFGWFHLASSTGSSTPLLSANVLGLFLVGLIFLPLLAAMPMVLIRHVIVDNLQEKQPTVAAFLPFARFALYALQGVLVWVATREAYAWAFGPGGLV